MLRLDGSHGEGGGQILRSALALSLVTGRPFRLEHIRAKRPRPGLMRQHLTAVLAARDISGAMVEGAEIGAEAIAFTPGPVRPGEYTFTVGTAGSTTLVLQTVLPALALAAGPSFLTLEGGTHNPFSPPFEFLDRAFLPLFNRLGPRVEARLERHGFYPAGGGKVRVSVTPTERFGRLELRERGELMGRRAVAMVSALPVAIAHRELAVLAQRLGWEDEACQVEDLRQTTGPGNVVAVELTHGELTERFTAFGRKGVPGEAVAAGVADEALAYLAAGVPVGEHLADQLLVPLALGGGGVFRTVEPSGHTRSQMELLKRFLDVEVEAEAVGGGAWEIRVGV